MTVRILPIAVLGGCLLLSGCYLVDGAAQAVKLASEKMNENKAQPAQPAASSAPAPTTQESAPPPPPVAVGPAPSVQVEELPPSR